MVKGKFLGAAVLLTAFGQIVPATAATPQGVASNRAALGLPAKAAPGARVQTDVRKGANNLQDSEAAAASSSSTGGYIVALAAVAAVAAGVVVAASDGNSAPVSP